MTIVFANLGASANPDISSGTDATSYANSSWTPPTSGLIICFVIAKRVAALDTPTMSGNSLTWTQIGSTLNCGGVNHGLSLFAADASGSSTGATTVSFGANTQIHCSASFFHATGVDLSGGVAAAFVQTVTATGTGTTGTVTLAAAANSNNRPIAGFFHAQNQAKTPRANWTEIDDLAGTSGIRNLETQYRDDAFETTATATWATSDNWGGVASELKADIVVPYGSPTTLSTAINAFMSLPGLRGFWPLNSFDEGGDAYDISGHGQTLTVGDTPTFNINQLGAGYVTFDATDYFHRAESAHYDIRGTEAYVGSGAKGLTLGGWFYFPSLGSGSRQLIYKSDLILNRAYELDNITSGSAQFGFAISGDGSTVKRASMAGTLSAGQWHFIVGRFTPSTEVAIFTNKTKAVNTSSIPASIFNSSVDFKIGGGPAWASMCFLSAEVISDALLDQLYEDTWPLFIPNEGTLAKTLGTLLASSAGTVAVSGVIAKTLGALTLSSSAVTTIGGSLSKTLGALTASSAGTVATGGSLAKTLGALTSTGAGAVALTGTLAKTLGDLTLISLGAGAGIQGNLNQTLGALTASSAGTVEIAGTLARTLGALTLASAGLTVEYRTYIITDGLSFNDTGQPVAPILVSTDSLTFTETIKAPLLLQTDTLTFTDTPVVTVAPIVIADTLTFDELLTVTGVTITPPATAATGGLDSNHVLRLLYGNDKRNPTRSLDIAQSAPGHIFLKSGGFAPGAGELNELWSGESIRHHGQKKLAESRKNSTLSITYDLSSGSMAGLSAVQREISRFFLEAKLQQVGRQGEKVWLEYRWADNLNSLPTPTFGQLSSYYEVYAAKSPRWPDDLHTGALVSGNIEEVTVELTCSPAPEGLKQRAANATGTISLHTHGVLIASGASSKLHWAGYTNSGLTGDFTITGWITHNTTWSSGTKDIFDYFVSASNRIRIQYDRGNTRWVITKIVAGTTYTANSSSDSVASGDHNHLILVQDDTTLYLYVNGVEVASVTATNNMTDGGTIALGCPASGSVDGVDVILDGWRILPDDITSTQALAIYTAELAIKQNSNRVGEPVYFWTKDGDGQLDNCDESARDNWGIIGGVGGDLDATTEIQLSSAHSNKYFWLGIRPQDSILIFNPFWMESQLSTVTADATASDGSYSLLSPTTSVTGSLVATDTADQGVLFGRYQLLMRVKTSGAASLTTGWTFSGSIPFTNKTTLLTNASFKVLSFGDMWIQTDTEDDNNLTNLVYFSLTASVAVAFGLDFAFLLPYPFAKITQPTNAISPTSFTPLVVSGGTAHVRDIAANNLGDIYEYTGGEIAATPNKYNYLHFLQLASDETFVRTDVADIAVYITPKYLLPGGMVA